MQVFLGLKTCWVLACTLTASTLDTVDNWVPASPADHSSWANIVSFACSLHFVNPRWPSWINFSISACFWLGITIFVPFRISPSSIVISSQNVQNACILFGGSFMLLGYPFCIVYLSMTRVSSACVDSCNCCKLSLLAWSWLVIWYTLSLGSLMESWSPPTLDKQSANWFFSPGR